MKFMPLVRATAGVGDLKSSAGEAGTGTAGGLRPRHPRDPGTPGRRPWPAGNCTAPATAAALTVAITPAGICAPMSVSPLSWSPPPPPWPRSRAPRTPQALPSGRRSRGRRRHSRRLAALAGPAGARRRTPCGLGLRHRLPNLARPRSQRAGPGTSSLRDRSAGPAAPPTGPDGPAGGCPGVPGGREIRPYQQRDPLSDRRRPGQGPARDRRRLRSTRRLPGSRPPAHHPA